MKGQAAIEYIITAVVIMLVVLPATYFLYAHQHTISQEVELAQANKIGRDIVNAAKQVYSMGEYTRVVIEENMPKSVVDVNKIFDIENEIYQLKIEVKTDAETSQLTFPSDVPIDGKFDAELFSPGIKRIKIEARIKTYINPVTGLPEDILVGWINLLVSCATDDDCEQDEKCSETKSVCLTCVPPPCGPADGVPCHVLKPHCGCKVDDNAGGCPPPLTCSKGECV